MNNETRIPLKNGDEYDFLTSWRRDLTPRSGVVKSVKRKYRHRKRREDLIENQLLLEEYYADLI